MSRVQLALNVSDIDQAVEFYSKLFGTSPAKRRPGYANFAIVEPPLKLVLIEGSGDPGTLNHLGVEVEDRAVVRSEAERLSSAGIKTSVEDNVDCCYAIQDKVWAIDPDGEPWEIYTVLGDAETLKDELRTSGQSDTMCCGPDLDLAVHSDASSCC